MRRNPQNLEPPLAAQHALTLEPRVELWSVNELKAAQQIAHRHFVVGVADVKLQSQRAAKRLEVIAHDSFPDAVQFAAQIAVCVAGFKTAPQQTRHLFSSCLPFNGEVRQQRHAFLGQLDLAPAPKNLSRVKETQLEVLRFHS